MSLPLMHNMWISIYLITFISSLTEDENIDFKNFIYLKEDFVFFVLSFISYSGGQLLFIERTHYYYQGQ